MTTGMVCAYFLQSLNATSRLRDVTRKWEREHGAGPVRRWRPFAVGEIPAELSV